MNQTLRQARLVVVVPNAQLLRHERRDEVEIRHQRRVVAVAKHIRRSGDVSKVETRRVVRV